MKVYSYREIVKIILRNNFTLARTKGDHEIYKHPDSRMITLRHGNVNRMIWQRLVKENQLQVQF